MQSGYLRALKEPSVHCQQQVSWVSKARTRGVWTQGDSPFHVTFTGCWQGHRKWVWTMVKQFWGGLLARADRLKIKKKHATYSGPGSTSGLPDPVNLCRLPLFLRPGCWFPEKRGPHEWNLPFILIYCSGGNTDITRLHCMKLRSAENFSLPYPPQNCDPIKKKKAIQVLVWFPHHTDQDDTGLEQMLIGSMLTIIYDMEV